MFTGCRGISLQGAVGADLGNEAGRSLNALAAQPGLQHEQVPELLGGASGPVNTGDLLPYLGFVHDACSCRQRILKHISEHAVPGTRDPTLDRDTEPALFPGCDALAQMPA